MTAVRLRPRHSTEELHRIYAAPHDHTEFLDHEFRVNATVAAGRALGPMLRMADLSCGDGAILKALPNVVETGDGYAQTVKIFGDLAPGYPYQGPLEILLHTLPPVDLYVCCETLEHLDDPASALALMREKAGRLLLSTPVDAWGDSNPEHYWAWSREDVEELLADAGWTATSYTTSDMRPSGFQYCFGIWTAQ